MTADRKTSTRAKTPTKAPAKPTKDDKGAEQTHRQRFDQLLDDAVFGKPTKR